MFAQDPSLSPELRSVDLEAGEEKERADAERREQGDGGIVMKEAEPRSGDRPEAEGGNGGGNAVPLQHLGQDQEGEQEDQIAGLDREREVWGEKTVEKKHARSHCGDHNTGFLAERSAGSPPL